MKLRKELKDFIEVMSKEIVKADCSCVDFAFERIAYTSQIKAEFVGSSITRAKLDVYFNYEGTLYVTSIFPEPEKSPKTRRVYDRELTISRE